MKVFKIRSAALRRGAVAAGLALALSGCWLIPTPFQGGTAALSKGVITAKGSIFVNGVEFVDNGADITIGDAPNHTDSDLKVGMVVEVKGTINGSTGKGMAAQILYAADLDGTIDAVPAIDTAAGTFYVFGHKVATDKNTVFDGVADLSGLAAGDRVEVSGIADAANNVLNATRVEKQTAGGEFAIKGVVSALGATSFTLTNEDGRSIVVDFTGTLAAGIANGSVVIVMFSSYANPLSVTADNVRLITELKADDNDRTEVSGIVSSFVAGDPATFTVDGVNVSASAALAAGVANGVRVEVKGTMVSGVLVAEKVKVEVESNIEAEGTASTVSTAASTLTLDGIVFSVTSSTIFRDESAANLTQFGLANIAMGDPLQVSGYTDTTGAIVATRVERQGGSVSTELSAPVTAVSISGNSLTMAGITVDVSGLLNKATLLAVSIGTEVTVNGTVSGTTFTATQGSLGD